MTEVTCSATGCGRQAKGRWCSAHYSRLRRLGAVRADVPIRSRVLLGASLILDPVTGCLLWPASISDTGYGSWVVDGKTRNAHRVAYEKAFGPIPDGLSVLHRCDVRACCNPDHLFLGTQADNMADASAKGRMSRGEARHNARLTESAVRAIRQSRAAGVSSLVLAREFGVSPRTIRDVGNRHTWKHLDASEEI